MYLKSVQRRWRFLPHRVPAPLWRCFFCSTLITTFGTVSATSGLWVTFNLKMAWAILSAVVFAMIPSTCSFSLNGIAIIIELYPFLYGLFTTLSCPVSQTFDCVSLSSSWSAAFLSPVAEPEVSLETYRFKFVLCAPSAGGTCPLKTFNTQQK